MNEYNTRKLKKKKLKNKKKLLYNIFINLDR